MASSQCRAPGRRKLQNGLNNLLSRADAYTKMYFDVLSFVMSLRDAAWDGMRAFLKHSHDKYFFHRLPCLLRLRCGEIGAMSAEQLVGKSYAPSPKLDKRVTVPMLRLL